MDARKFDRTIDVTLIVFNLETVKRTVLSFNFFFVDSPYSKHNYVGMHTWHVATSFYSSVVQPLLFFKSNLKNNRELINTHGCNFIEADPKHSGPNHQYIDSNGGALHLTEYS